MKLSIKFLIITAVFFLAFTSRASAAFHFDDPRVDSFVDHDLGFNGGHNGNSNKTAALFLHPVTVNPEPVSYVLFLFGAGILAYSYRQRKKILAA